VKYCIVIMDGAAGLPLPERNGETCLELAHTPNLDALAREGTLGLARTVPSGIEPSSACACMSILGYDPRVYYQGRAGIEARSMGIPIGDREVAFRCNLVTVRDGRMWDYSAGHISTDEAHALVASLEESLGSEKIHFYPGVSYRHICKLEGHQDSLLATCTPPHNIPGKPVEEFLPKGLGSNLLRDLMKRSEVVLQKHPVNIERKARSDIPATTIWLFWGSGKAPEMPAFSRVYGLNGAMTSGVDLLRGMARIMGMDVLDIAGVTDGLDNDYAAQATGVVEVLDKYDLVIIHIEAPDEAAHAGSIDDKIESIQRIDGEIISRLHSWGKDALRLLIMPDHPTPITVQTHTSDPVPFLLWGQGFSTNGAKRFTEAEAKSTDLFIDPGYNIMGKLIG